MAFLRFGCAPTVQDPLLNELLGAFKATPFLPPSAEVQPLMLVGHRGQKTHHYGPLEEIFIKTGVPFQLKPDRAASANVDLTRTAMMNFDLGFQLLDGLFKGFDLKIDPLKATLGKAKEIGLSFKNVQKRYITNTELGSALINQKINLEHPSMAAFLREEKPLGMYVVSSVLQSNEFTVHLGKISDGELDIKAPEIEQLTNVGLKVEGDRDTNYTITHKGKKYLTFAFACFQLKYDSTGNKLSLEEEQVWAKGTDGAIKEKQSAEEVSFIDSKLPAILSWDE